MLLNDTLEIRLCSPDFQEDWGVVGDPQSVTLDLTRKTASVLEMHVLASDPTWQLLLRENCGVQVRFRGRTEFLGHVYRRGGGVAPDAPMTVWARDETEEFDNTLAWVVPDRTQFAGSFGGIYSSGNIEPTEMLDQAQSFPDPWIDPGHYNWGWPYWNLPFSPYVVGNFIGPLISRNLKRKGYTRARLVSASDTSQQDMASLTGNGAGAPYEITKSANWLATQWTPPWVDSFSGTTARFSTLREAVAPFMWWADLNTDESFSLFVDGQIGSDVVLGYKKNPPEYSIPLSVQSGTVVDGDWTISEHSASRVVLGGPGDLRERMFSEYRVPAREEFGRVIEAFKDATGAQLSTDDTGESQYKGYPRSYFVDATVNDIYKQRVRNYMERAANGVFVEAGPQSGVSVELQETGEIYYGGESGYQLGQFVQIDLGWAQFRERVNKVTITLTRTDGLKVVPQVGEREDNADEAVAASLAALRARQRLNNSER